MNPLTLLMGLGFLAALSSAPGHAAAYDPLAVTVPKAPTMELQVRDHERRREIPLLLHVPEAGPAAPVILFSHGLGGSRHAGQYLGRHWAARGYVVVFVQHPGSDESVWREVPQETRRAALKKAANSENYLLRLRDITAVLDQLTIWQQLAGHPLHGRLDLQRIGMSGHSFGALTTQAVSGQTLPLVGTSLSEPRIKAALALSPGKPRHGDAAAAFASVRIPWLLMTGTRDDSPIGKVSPASRQEVYPALPPGGKYELVLHEAQHSAFSDHPLRGNAARNPNHHRVILALSTAFWDCWLRANPAAHSWLDGWGPSSVLQANDRWQKK